ncbi:MAG: hypothetical protein R2795_11060 [Saprospiraceae bacterium]
MDAKCGTTSIASTHHYSDGRCLRKRYCFHRDQRVVYYDAYSGLARMDMLSYGVRYGTFFKTAQGSSTAALVITSSILAPLAPAFGFVQPQQIALLVVSIGAGGMAISHANDSYFWVVSQFGNIAPDDAFRSYSLMSLGMALLAFVTVLLLYGIIF